MIKKILILLVFLVNYLFSFQLLSNDYMSIELQKAIDLECKKSVKNNLFDTKEECRNSIIEILNKDGIVSVTRVNDQEIQKEIEEICVFAKKRGAVNYNKCIQKQVYAYLGIEIFEMPLVVNEPIKEEEVVKIVESVNLDEETKESNTSNLEMIDDSEIFEEIELDREKMVTEIKPDLEITEPKTIEMPENVKAIVSGKALPSTYFVQTWAPNKDTSSKIKYLPAGSGSAVAIEKDLLATACHVVTERFFNDDTNKVDFNFLITNIVHVNDDSSDQKNWIRKLELYAHDFESDRCILKSENLNAIPAETRDYKDLKFNETVYAVGNPRGYFGRTVKGEITRLYDFVPPVDHLLLTFRNRQIEIIETNTPVDKGNSGGGLFDIEGNLIGIASMCDNIGGPVVCYDQYGRETFEPENRDEQCIQYCNKVQPQNWFIPISRYPELTTNDYN